MTWVAYWIQIGGWRIEHIAYRSGEYEGANEYVVCLTDLTYVSLKINGECGWNYMIRPLDLANHTVLTTFPY